MILTSPPKSRSKELPTTEEQCYYCQSNAH